MSSFFVLRNYYEMKLKFLKKSFKKEIFMVNYNNKKKTLVRRMALKQHKEIDDD